MVGFVPRLVQRQYTTEGQNIAAAYCEPLQLRSNGEVRFAMRMLYSFGWKLLIRGTTLLIVDVDMFRLATPAKSLPLDPIR